MNSDEEEKQGYNMYVFTSIIEGIANTTNLQI